MSDLKPLVGVLFAFLLGACPGETPSGSSDGSSAQNADAGAAGDGSIAPLDASVGADSGGAAPDTGVCVPAAEVCDGLDNDCDITVDNEPQASQGCDDQDRCTTDVCSVGACLHYPNGQCDKWMPMDEISAPPARFRHSAVWTGSQMIVWGGTDGTVVNTYNRGAAYDPATNAWEPVPFERTSSPSFRALHTAVWTGTEMIIWGGYPLAPPFLDDGGRYNPATKTWVKIPSVLGGGSCQAPLLCPRIRHTAVWTGKEMIVWGGHEDGYVAGNGGGRYDPATENWAPVTIDNAPSARVHHTAVWTGTEMIVFGGTPGDGDPLSDGGAYNPTTNSWRAISTVNAPALSEHTAVWTGEKMLVWGGSTPLLAATNEGAIYDPSTDTWEPLPLTGAPQARLLHVAVWTGREMVIWSGNTYEADGDEITLNDGGAFDLEHQTWRTITISGSPSSRGYASAVWTGTAMLVWGGWRYNPDETFEAFKSGGIYTP